MSKRERSRHEQKAREVLVSRFKKIVRTIIFNSYWLTLTEDSDKIKHTPLVMRRKRTIGTLTAADKSIIRMQHQSRTVADRKQLCLAFVKLKCFARFPPKVCARLVPVIKFMSIARGRVIMARGDLPFALYFILTGEVQMIKTSYSPLYDKDIKEIESIFGPGECIGDAAILEKTVRKQTFVASSQCELLVLLKYGLPIIEPYMKKHWLEKKRALKALDYFDFFNEGQIINACRFGQIRQYNPLDSIYSKDQGSFTNVHFVLSGECIILQYLNLKVTKKNGKKMFSLPIWKNTDSKIMVAKTSSYVISQRNTINNEMGEEISNLLKSTITFDAQRTEKRMDRKELDRLCGLNKLSPKSSSYRIRKGDTTPDKYFDEQYDYLNFTDSNESEDKVTGMDNNNNNILTILDEKKSSSNESEVFTITPSYSSSLSTSNSDEVESLVEVTPEMDDYESHFVDVGSLTFGGIFGLGEKMEDRVILARTTVHCLTLPRYFLFEKDQNPGNIWQRRLFYLNCTIPSREKVFTEFLNARKWKAFKKKFIYTNIDDNPKDISKNYDIPIICRIIENSDDEENT